MLKLDVCYPLTFVSPCPDLGAFGRGQSWGRSCRAGCSTRPAQHSSRVMGQESLAARGGFWDEREDRCQIRAGVLAAGNRHSSRRGRGAAAVCT